MRPRHAARLLRATIFVVTALTALVGCARRDKQTSAVPARTQSFAFEQTQARRASAPTLEVDVEIGSGLEEWRLEVSCRDHDVPCREASVEMRLSFDAASGNDVRLDLRAEGEAPSTLPEPYCWERDFEGGDRRRCTLRASDGWTEADTPSPAHRRRGFVARVQNGGPRLRAHLSLVVIDPLE
jgi:hypothetical protein